MNPITIVLLALEGTSAALSLAQKFITNKSVLTVLADVQQAISLAESMLGGLHAEFAEGVKSGRFRTDDPGLGGLEAKKKG